MLDKKLYDGLDKMLAGCGANKHMVSRGLRFRTIALQYYAEALRRVNNLVPEVKKFQSSPSEALMCCFRRLYALCVGYVPYCRQP